MASTVSLPLSVDSQPGHRHRHRHLYHTTHVKSHPKHTPFLNPKHTHPLTIFPKSDRYTLTHSSSTSSSTLQDPLHTTPFLPNEDLEKLKILEYYKYHQELESGSLWIRVMREEDMDMTVKLLSESFVASILLSTGYVTLLGILMKQYLIERRTLMPHTATLIGFYRGDEEGEEDVQVAGTVEVRFDMRGANGSPPIPAAPKNSPYVCNMAVKKQLRRRGIGWHLLKASEELISQMSSSREVYLHCRMIDAAPFNMYTKAGYDIVKTDSILILLTAQRRKHLMRKQLPVLNSPSETDGSYSNKENPS